MVYIFEWDKGNGFLQLPVKVKKCVDDDFNISGKMVCNECHSTLEQKYLCNNCGKQYKKGEITKRWDEENNIFYDISEFKSFIEQNVEKKITVEKEVDLDIVFFNSLYFLRFFEIYNNDNKAKQIMAKLHKHLYDHRKGLLVKFGYKGQVRGGLIIPSLDRLVLVELRDKDLVREAKQEDIETIVLSDDIKILESVSEVEKKNLYLEFIKRKLNGEVITVKEKPKEEVAIVMEGEIF